MRIKLKKGLGVNLEDIPGGVKTSPKLSVFDGYTEIQNVMKWELGSFLKASGLQYNDLDNAEGFLGCQQDYRKVTFVRFLVGKKIRKERGCVLRIKYKKRRAK